MRISSEGNGAWRNGGFQCDFFFRSLWSRRTYYINCCLVSHGVVLGVIEVVVGGGGDTVVVVEVSGVVEVIVIGWGCFCGCG